MTTYRIDHHDGGTVTLKSGTWRWIPVRLLSLPEQRVETQHLFFAHEEMRGDTMMIRIDPALDELSNEQLIEFALNPNERRVITRGVEYNIMPPEEGDQERMFRVRGPTNMRFKIQLPPGARLGELEHEELAHACRIM